VLDLLRHLRDLLERPQTNDQVAGADQRRCFLLSDRTMGNRTQDLRIEPRASSQLLRIRPWSFSWYFRDKVLRRIFHGQQSLRSFRIAAFETDPLAT
jgi:hypothetical protein